MPRNNLMDTNGYTSEVGSSNRRKIVGYKSVQIPVYEEYSLSMRINDDES